MQHSQRGNGAPTDAQYPQLAGNFITTVPFTVYASTLRSAFHWEDQNYSKSPTSCSRTVFALLGSRTLPQRQLLPATLSHIAAVVCCSIVCLIVHQKAITRGMGSHCSPCVGGQCHLHRMGAQRALLKLAPKARNTQRAISIRRHDVQGQLDGFTLMQCLRWQLAGSIF